MKPNSPYNFICVEGNIGVGKTSFCHKFAVKHKSKLVLEGFADNPFLPLFYNNPARYGFSVELFFMTERHKQMQEAFSGLGLFEDMIISDYSFPKTLLFAKTNLSDEEFRLFNRLYEVLFSQFPKPDLLVYLHRGVDQLLEQIHQRGRAYEMNITGEYLQSIQDAYFEFFRGQVSYPIVIIDVQHLDFVHNEADYLKIEDLIRRPYRPGVHRISLVT